MLNGRHGILRFGATIRPDAEDISVMKKAIVVAGAQAIVLFSRRHNIHRHVPSTSDGGGLLAIKYRGAHYKRYIWRAIGCGYVLLRLWLQVPYFDAYEGAAETMRQRSPI